MYGTFNRVYRVQSTYHRPLFQIHEYILRKGVLTFFDPLHKKTFSEHKVRENCHFLTPTPMSIRKKMVPNSKHIHEFEREASDMYFVLTRRAPK